MNMSIDHSTMIDIVDHTVNKLSTILPDSTEMIILTIVLSAFNLRLLITVLESSTFSYIILNLNMSSWCHFTISWHHGGSFVL
jgi:hypothetical protein